MNSYRKNGNFVVIYGVILPDTIKHVDDAGNPVDGYVLSVQTAPFCDATLDEAKHTGWIIYQREQSTVVWYSVVNVGTGEVEFRCDMTGITGGSDEFDKFIRELGVVND